jgi:hypothetical protein
MQEVKIKGKEGKEGVQETKLQRKEKGIHPCKGSIEGLQQVISQKVTKIQTNQIPVTPQRTAMFLD